MKIEELLTDAFLKDNLEFIQRILKTHFGREKLKALAKGFETKVVESYSTTNQTYITAIVCNINTPAEVRRLLEQIIVRLVEKRDDGKNDFDILKGILNKNGLDIDNKNMKLSVALNTDVKIFARMDEIEKKLYTFNKGCYNYYINAKKSFLEGKSVSEIRNCFEEILNRLLSDYVPYEEAKRLDSLSKIKKLQTHGILDKAPHKGRDIITDHFYSYYQLLSHFGSHPTDIDDLTKDYIFSITNHAIWYLLSKISNLQLKNNSYVEPV
jgi:hypothetical protein